MGNNQRLEDIRSRVKISTLLSDHEKSDWLNLLDLMNDKQLGELEEILASEPATATFAQQPAAAQPASGSKTPPLSHLANIPSDVNMTHSVPAIPIRQAPPAPSAFPAPQGAKVMPPLSVRPAAPAPPGVLPIQSKASPVSSPVSPSRPVMPTPTSKPVQPQSDRPLATFVIQKVEYLQRLDVNTIRDYHWQSIFDVIKKAISENGYFVILQLIEASPLYASYIQAGAERLGATSGSPSSIATKTQSSLTQAEFEFMTDLLRNIRFNRW
jgi:hypothetical protein